MQDMSIDALHLPEALRLTALLLQWLLMGLAASRVPWRLLGTGGRELHVVLGSTLAVAVLWTLGGSPLPGLRLHLLGITALTLLVGSPIALPCGAIAIALSQLLLRGSLDDWALQCMLGVNLPILSTELILRTIRQHGPRNPYAYWLGAGFLGGGIGMGLHAAASVSLLHAADMAPPFLTFSPALVVLLMFPEAFLNGAVMTALAVYRPDWVRSFRLADFLPPADRR